jgi:gamma-glutamylcyclotransferase (GGCT)/AIG2-like uncharacterized protein YtfP
MDVFVYGTLTDPAQVDRLLDEWSFGPDAVLDGLRRVDGEYPTLAPGGSVEGRILRTPEIEVLDAYEGVDRGLYVRETVPWEGAGEADAVAVCVGDPDRLGADATWPGDGAFAARVRRYLDDQAVCVRPQ